MSSKTPMSPRGGASPRRARLLPGVGRPDIDRADLGDRLERPAAGLSADHVIQLQRLIGNRATRGLVGEPVVQRMVAVAVDDVEKTTDSLVHNNAAYAEKVYGGPIVELRPGGDYQAAAKRSLVIVEHGEPGKIAKHDAAWVATQLHNGGMPADVARVILYSCFAASEELASKKSLVTELAEQLEARYPGAKIPVWGQTGIGFAFEGIRERTTKSGLAESAAAWYKAKWDLSHAKKHASLFAKPDPPMTAGDLAKMTHLPPQALAVVSALAKLDASAKLIDFKNADDMIADANDVLAARGEAKIQIPQQPDFAERSRIITRLMKPFWEDAQNVKPLADELTKQGWRFEFS